MATQITATTPRTRPAPRFGVLEVALLAVIVVGVIGAAVWSEARSIRDVAIDSQGYGAGYPFHGGLAGPSGVGQVSTVAATSGRTSAVDLADHYGPGYPLHGGLAGPSGVDSGVDSGD